jgi:Subtilase family
MKPGCQGRGRVAGAIAALLLIASVSTARAAPAPPGGPPPQAPLILPGDAQASSLSYRTAQGWIVAGQPGPASRAIARRIDAHPLLPAAGIYQVPTAQARAFARALDAAGVISFAEPNARVSRAAFPSDPLTPQQPWLRQIVPAILTPPTVRASSPVLGMLEESVDAAHPEISGGNVTGLVSMGPGTDEHGTAVTAVAAAPANGVGIVGVWPGMRVRLIPNGKTCGTAIRGVNQAIQLRLPVINMSYGFPFGACFGHFVVTQFAFGAGIVPVAAGGNEFLQGNPLNSPGFDNHILTVAGLNPDLTSAQFSNENPGIDVSAPAVAILTAVPAAIDPDGTLDGFTLFDGTSFSAPMVAAISAWLRQVRPRLSNDQVAGVLNRSATDLGPRGYDVRFGFGLVNLRRALSTKAPPVDPLEPNDDIEWVNGQRFRRADPFLWHPGQRRSRVSATIDAVEDPADVYRVRFKAGGTVRFVLNPRFGNPDLEVWSSRAKSIYGRTGPRIARSRRGLNRNDVLLLRNRSRHRATVFVDVYVGSNRIINSSYVLSVGPAR